MTDSLHACEPCCLAPCRMQVSMTCSTEPSHSQWPKIVVMVSDDLLIIAAAFAGFAAQYAIGQCSVDLATRSRLLRMLLMVTLTPSLSLGRMLFSMCPPAGKKFLFVLAVIQSASFCTRFPIRPVPKQLGWVNACPTVSNMPISPDLAPVEF